jgi:hypothetical protein
MEKNPHFIFAILIFIFLKLIVHRSLVVNEKNYTVTSAGMSGGRKWEDFRWEDGWPVERA